MTLSRTALLALAATVALVCSSFTAQASIVVASEDFSSALNPITSGLDNNPGRWAANGYNHSGHTDTEPNMGILNIVPTRISGEVSGVAGQFRTETTSQIQMDGIKMFATAAGADRPAVAGQVIDASFEVFFQNGEMSFGLVSDLAALQASQLAASVTAPAFPRGISTQNNSNFFGGVSGLIGIDPGGNGVVRAIDNVGGFANSSNTLTDEGGALVVSGDVAGWQRIFFSYTVGSATYDSMGWEQYIDDQNIGLGTATYTITDSGSPVPVGPIGSQIVGIVFSGNGSGILSPVVSEYYIDNLNITVTPEPGVLALLGVGALVLCRFHRRR